MTGIARIATALRGASAWPSRVIGRAVRRRLAPAATPSVSARIRTCDRRGAGVRR